MKLGIPFFQRLLITVGVIFFLFVFPHSIGGDGFVRYTSLLDLLEKGHVGSMVYSYVGPLFSTPLYMLGHLYRDPFWWLSRYNAILCLITAFLLWREFREHWTKEQGRVFVLLFLFGSMLPRHSVDYYSEVFSACTACLAVIFFLKQRFALGTLAIFFSTLNTPGTLGAAAMLCCYLFWQERSLRFLLLPLLCFAGMLLENRWKSGYFFPHEYMTVKGAKNLLPYSGGPGFSYPLFFGLISVFFSSGKGLLFFTPGLLCAFIPGFFRKDLVGRFLYAALFYIAGLVFVFARWWCWSGDWFWGPRFYLFASLWAAIALTYSLPLIRLNLRRHLFWIATTILSLWVGCEGILYGQDFLEDCFRLPGTEFMCSYVPEYSVLWRFFIVWPTPHGRKVAFLCFFFLVLLSVLWLPMKDFFTLLLPKMRAEFVRCFNFKDWKF